MWSQFWSMAQEENMEYEICKAHSRNFYTSKTKYNWTKTNLNSLQNIEHIYSVEIFASCMLEFLELNQFGPDYAGI